MGFLCAGLALIFGMLLVSLVIGAMLIRAAEPTLIQQVSAGLAGHATSSPAVNPVQQVFLHARPWIFAGLRFLSEAVHVPSR